MDITITEFQNRRKPIGKVVHTTWEDLVERLRTPVISGETLDEYFAMTNEERTEVKDCGGYVAGEFDGGKRSKDKLKSQFILTIDADDATEHDIEDYSALEDYIFVAHTTHTSTTEHPRLRWLFPPSRPVTAEEYHLLVGVAKSWVGADTIDETTGQPERLMFWPSVPLDSDYYFFTGGSVVLDPDSILDRLESGDISPTVGKTGSSGSTLFDKDRYLQEGQRNNGVFVFAARLRTFGLEENEIISHVRDYNDDHCNPVLPESEFRTIVHSAYRYPKGELIPFNMRDSAMDFGDLGKEKEKPKKHVIGEQTTEDLWKENIGEQEYIEKILFQQELAGSLLLLSSVRVGCASIFASQLRQVLRSSDLKLTSMRFCTSLSRTGSED